ncbi:MAG TPA: TetR/AcrR family transcriptional regulator [Actinomycetota bacterium]|jgi:AcrR family transcriptional regulator|nr:TetR/AcrR family transcriptional regulator [Actinomycetota bacterium]
MSVKSLRDEHADATRAALLSSARELFTQHGFNGVSAEQIAKHARVTRGALYHHFEDKKELFGSVCDEVGDEVGQRVQDIALPLANEDPWRGFGLGVDEFLDACAEDDFWRRVVLEGPAVFGWQEWREHGEQHMIGLIKLGLQMLMDAGIIARQPIELVAPMLFSVMTEAAMVIVHADDRKTARREVGETVHRLIEGLRINS